MTLVVIDTSAVVALLDDEPAAGGVRSALDAYPERLMAAPTLTELLLVARRLWGPHGAGHVNAFLRLTEVIVEAVDERMARAAAAALQRYGKGVHPAALNYGDSFSYALAERLQAPLLFVGNDFSQTDVRAAIELAS